MVTSVMRGINIRTLFWTEVLLVLTVIKIGVCLNDSMKCRYGDRGSLTVTCFNATPSFFRLSAYKFDHLDETLRCQDCILTIIDSGTFDLSGNQIKNLDLRNSKIETIKNRAFVGLIFLEDLDLSQNLIRQISPGTFAAVKKIRKINLSYNLINVINEDGFAELENLETLIIQQNFIKMIVPRGFNGLINLVHLELQSNLISDISSEVFTNVSSLRYIDLSVNKLTSLKGKEFYNLTNLNELDLSYNEISLASVELAPGNLLKKLNMSHNRLRQLDNSALIRLQKLEVLDLSNNQILSVSKRSFQDMFDLHALYLPYNNLTEFKTGTFTGLPQLRFLNCSHNNIESVEITGVFSLNSLHTLDISYNKLTDLDHTLIISRLPRINYLRMEGNPLPCSLESEMLTVFAEDNIKFVVKDKNSNCTDKPTMTQTYIKLVEDIILENYENLSTGEICIVVLLCIVFVLIGVLFILQYRVHTETYYRAPRRAVSTSHLISEMEVHDGIA